MKILASKEITIHGLHMSVNHITGAMGVGERISKGKFIKAAAKLDGCFKGRTIREIVKSPNCEVSHQNIILSFGRGLVNSPNFVAKLKVSIAQTFATTADFDEGMEETQNRGNRWKEGVPCING